MCGRFLHRHYPDIRPLGLIDTLRLARTSQLKGAKGLGALLDRFELREQVDQSVPIGRPNRALWDPVAAAVLLARLVEEDPTVRTLGALVAAASVPLGRLDEDPTLF